MALSGTTKLATVEAIDVAPPPAAAALLGVLSALRARWSALPHLSDRAAYFATAARPLLRVHFLDAVWRWASTALGLRRGTVAGGSGSGSGSGSAAAGASGTVGAPHQSLLRRSGAAALWGAVNAVAAVGAAVGRGRSAWEWSAACSLANGVRWVSAGLRVWEYREESLSLAAYLAAQRARPGVSAALSPQQLAGAVAAEGDVEGEVEGEVEVEASELLLGALKFAVTGAARGAAHFVSSSASVLSGTLGGTARGDGRSSGGSAKGAAEGAGGSVALVWGDECVLLDGVADAVVELIVDRLHSEVRRNLRAYRLAAQQEAGREGEAHAAWCAVLEHVSATLRRISVILAKSDFHSVCGKMDALLDSWFHLHIVRTFARGTPESQLQRGANAMIAFTREEIAPQCAVLDGVAVSDARAPVELRRSAPRASDTRTLLNLSSEERAELYGHLSLLAPSDDAALASDSEKTLSPEVRQMASILDSGYQIEHLPPRDALHLLGALA